MCRWLAYSGSPIFLDVLLTRPEHSLIDQSLFATMNYVTGDPEMDMFRNDAFPTNADGFGFGWYGEQDLPGQYRDCRPAFNDGNLHRLAAQVKSPLFLAHVRAAAGGPIQRTNNHPFQHRHWLFQHNGEINGWPKVMRDLRMDVAPELYPCIQGTTDSETCFFLALTYGLADDAPRALSRMVARVERARREHDIDQPFRLTCCATDGETLYALRYSSNHASKTLYHSTNIQALQELHNKPDVVPPDAVIIVSEPLDKMSQHWAEVPESTLLTVAGGEVRAETFLPSSN